ncbi:MAG: hypothetical protein ACREIT_10600 [Tepidisphaeraceae bacterium]
MRQAKPPTRGKTKSQARDAGKAHGRDAAPASRRRSPQHESLKKHGDKFEAQLKR